jgi:hypothetical protein
METINDPAGDICPNCRRELVGVIEVTETETEGVRAVLLQESSDRNWIECDSCSLVVCKACCKDSESGLCNGCIGEPNDKALADNTASWSRSFSGGAGQ